MIARLQHAHSNVCKSADTGAVAGDAALTDWLATHTTSAGRQYSKMCLKLTASASQMPLRSHFPASSQERGWMVGQPRTGLHSKRATNVLERSRPTAA
jgi:hypothetical protein